MTATAIALWLIQDASVQDKTRRDKCTGQDVAQVTGENKGLYVHAVRRGHIPFGSFHVSFRHLP